MLGLGNTLSGGIVPAAATGYTNTYSLAFGGTDEYVIMDAHTYDTGSWAMWIKYASTGIIVFNCGGYYYLYEAGGQLKFNYPGRASISTIASGVNDDNWHHVAITITRPGDIGTTSTIKVYLDGAIEGTTTGTREFVLSSERLYFGRYSSSALYYTGNIDEVGWCEGHILTDAEVTQLYNSGEPTDLQTDSGNYTSSGDLTGYWRMGDGDSYPTITDNEGSNDGTMEAMESGDIVTEVPTA